MEGGGRIEDNEKEVTECLEGDGEGCRRCQEKGIGGDKERVQKGGR